MEAGSKLKDRARRLKLKPMQICVEADNLSLTTLRSFFNDDPKCLASTARRIIDAIDRLEARKDGSRAAS